jgi:hypothetical protein
MKKKKKKSHLIYYMIIGFVFICILLTLYDKYKLASIDGVYDIKVSETFETLPSDSLITSYDEYTKFLKNNLSIKEYNSSISDNIINSSTFEKYDYIAIFYESRMCPNNSNSMKSVSLLKSKIILSVTRQENSKCNLLTRVSFIPIEKNKYETLPNIIVEKQIIQK